MTTYHDSPARSYIFGVFCLCALVCCVLWSEQAEGQSSGEILDSVVAVIDGEPVTASELRRYISVQDVLGAASGEAGMSGSKEVDSAGLPRQRLRDLISIRLLEKEAQEAGIAVSQDELEAYVAEIKQQNGLNDEQFLSLLSERGISKEVYLSQVRSDVLRNRVVGARVRSKISVVEEDVQRYLQHHPELKPEVGALRLEQLRVPVSELQEEQQSKLFAAQEEMRQASTLGELTQFKAYYKDLGVVALRDLRPEIANAINGLSSGEVSEVVKIDRDVAVFKVVEVKEGVVEIEPALKEKIKDELFREKFAVEVKKYLEVDLPKKYQVEYTSGLSIKG